MTEDATITWVWWITVVEIPVLGGLFWLVHQGRREADRAMMRMYGQVQNNVSTVLQTLAQSRLEVARHYATVTDLKDVEKRLTDHLLRLEHRLSDVMSSDLTRPPRQLGQGVRGHGS